MVEQEGNRTNHPQSGSPTDRAAPTPSTLNEILHGIISNAENHPDIYGGQDQRSAMLRFLKTLAGEGHLSSVDIPDLKKEQTQDRKEHRRNYRHLLIKLLNTMHVDLADLERDIENLEKDIEDQRKRVERALDQVNIEADTSTPQGRAAAQEELRIKNEIVHERLDALQDSTSDMIQDIKYLETTFAEDAIIIASKLSSPNCDIVFDRERNVDKNAMARELRERLAVELAEIEELKQELIDLGIAGAELDILIEQENLLLEMKAQAEFLETRSRIMGTDEYSQLVKDVENGRRPVSDLWDHLKAEIDNGLKEDTGKFWKNEFWGDFAPLLLDIEKKRNLVRDQRQIDTQLKTLDEERKTLNAELGDLTEGLSTNQEIADVITRLEAEGSSRSYFMQNESDGGRIWFHLKNASGYLPMVTSKYETVEAHVNHDGKIVFQDDNGQFFTQDEDGQTQPITKQSEIIAIRAQMWLEGKPLGNETSYGGSIFTSLAGGRSIELAQIDVEKAHASLNEQTQAIETQIADIQSALKDAKAEQARLIAQGKTNSAQLAQAEQSVQNGIDGALDNLPGEASVERTCSLVPTQTASSLLESFYSATSSGYQKIFVDLESPRYISGMVSHAAKADPQTARLGDTFEACAQKPEPGQRSTPQRPAPQNAADHSATTASADNPLSAATANTAALPAGTN